jgi:hypothetical protein
MSNLRPKRLTERVELVLSRDEAVKLDAIREARTDHDPVSRNSVMRALIREEHARLGQEKTDDTD